MTEKWISDHCVNPDDGEEALREGASGHWVDPDDAKLKNKIDWEDFREEILLLLKELSCSVLVQGFTIQFY
jgi:hypothetical protein